MWDEPSHHKKSQVFTKIALLLLPAGGNQVDWASPSSEFIGFIRRSSVTLVIDAVVNSCPLIVNHI